MPITPLPDERLDAVNRGLYLLQKKKGLSFGTDAFLLAAFCRAKKAGRAVEFGCGSGVVSLLLAARGAFAHITAAELSPALFDVACRNIENNGFSDTVLPLLADVRQLSPADLGFEADAVIANPPYFKPGAGRPSPHAERQSARQETAGDIFDFAAAAGRCLKFGGLFTCVWRPDRMEALFAALRAAFLAPKRAVFVAAHPAAAPSLLLVEAKKGAGEGLVWLPTLFLRESAQKGAPATARAAAVYADGVWPAF